jgi:hypothetical protein
MAYNPYYSQGFYQNAPQYYPNMQMQQPQQMAQNQPQMAQNATQNQSNGITWVLGEAAAKSFPVGAGQTVILMDREEPVMYMKSSDMSGMPQPLRIFDITERTSEKHSGSIAQSEDFVSRKEFEEFREDVKRSIKGIRKTKSEEEGEG